MQSASRPKLRIHRLEGNPIIHPGLFANADGENINGPSLVSAPDWLPGRLGRYYLYFGHHHGRYIRLAFADRLAGAWTIYDPGTLHLRQARACQGHIASPDVHVDEQRREITMFFHGPLAVDSQRQMSFLARSKDGLTFDAGCSPLAPFYLRTAIWNGEYVGITMGGRLHVSADGKSEFAQVASHLQLRLTRMRHAALHVADDTLHVYYTRIGDAPERILRSRIVLAEDPGDWRMLSGDEEILKPEAIWEGADLPLMASERGIAGYPANALRDPAIFTENGQSYLLYAVAGEQGIAVARIEEPPTSSIL